MKKEKNFKLKIFKVRFLKIPPGYLRGGLRQAYDGLPLRCGGHRVHLQVVGLQLCDSGEEGRAGQRGSREMGGRSVHLFVAPEIQGDLFADGGRPGAPLVLNGCVAGQDREEGV